MLFFFTPYSLSGKLFDAYDTCIQLLPNKNDWACLTDGDTMFLRSNFGHIIQEYIDAYPETGLFTAYASRCFYQYQVPSVVDQNNPSLRYHKQIANTLAKSETNAVTEIKKQIAGHLFVIQKKTWLRIREAVKKQSQNETIEGVDTAISLAILKLDLKIYLMKSVYMLHYFRLVEGIKSKHHLGYGRHLHIITPCARPENLHTIAQSINIPRTSFTWWIVFDFDQHEVDKMLIPQNAKILWHKNKNSVAGNAQRNYAIGHINDGMVYFLDDDTLLHPDLYLNTCSQGITADFIHFDQQNPDGSKRIGGTVKLNHIDTGSAVVSRIAIGDTRFRTDLYNADGFFWMAINQKHPSTLYINKFLSVYNQISKS